MSTDFTFPEVTVTALLGQAVGDAFGAPYEFNDRAVELAEKSLAEQRYLDAYTDCGSTIARARTRGLYTDDTQQALTLLWAWRQIVERGKEPLDRGLAGGLFIRLSRRMAQEKMPGDSFGVHRGTGKNFRDAITSGSPPDTAGLGAAMRIGPVATLLPREEVVAPWVRAVSLSTTTNEIALAAAAYQGLAAYSATTGTSWGLMNNPGFNFAWDLLDEARQVLVDGGEDALVTFARTHTEATFDRASSGFALTGMAWVMQAVEEATDFPDALRRASSAGGDTDTLCAMAGCLAALRFGRAAIPAWMLDGLVGIEHILDPTLWRPVLSERALTALDHELRSRLAHEAKNRPRKAK